MATPREPSVLACRVIAQERAGLAQALQRAVGTGIAVEGSVPAADVRWLEEQAPHQRELPRRVLAGALEDAAVIIAAVDEHARAIEALLACSPPPLVSMFTLARSLHEAALTLCWLYDPQAGTERRLVRSAAVRLAAVEGTHRGMDDFPALPPGHLARSQQEMEGTRDFFRRAGFEFFPRKEGQRYSASITRAGIREELTLNATDAAHRYTPDSTFLWRGGSGAAHSRVWFTGGLDAADPRGALAVVMPLLDVAAALVRVLAAYGGFDAAHYHRKTNMRRMALAHASADLGPLTQLEEYADATMPEPERS